MNIYAGLVSAMDEREKMSGEKNLPTLLKSMKPEHKTGEYVYCVFNNLENLHINEIVGFFREREGLTIILRKEIADNLGLKYLYVASLITLTVHSSLEAVGLTAAFSNVLSENNISCNVVAAYYHDHIFVDIKDTEKALEVLKKLAEQS